MTKKRKDVNIYFIENNTSELAKQGKGGQFYNVYRSIGPTLEIKDFMDVTNDLFEIEEAAVNVDPTFKRIGGCILARDEEIASLSIFETSGNKLALQSIETSRIKVIEIEKIKLFNKRAEILQLLRLTDLSLQALENEENTLVKK
jgi:hypothetical protein